MQIETRNSAIFDLQSALVLDTALPNLERFSILQEIACDPEQDVAQFRLVGIPVSQQGRFFTWRTLHVQSRNASDDTGERAGQGSA
jgi:hypothetical protein